MKILEKKRTWAEIDLDIIKNNYLVFKDIVGKDIDLMAVVKADAYGHGQNQVAKKLQETGCENFAVATLNEAITLREAGIKGQILILGYTPLSEVDKLIKYDITQTIISEEYGDKISDKRLKVTVALNSGMNRIGLDAKDTKYCEKTIRKFYEKFNLTGIFTHLCVADDQTQVEYTKMQMQRFEKVVKSVKDLNVKYLHCLNTAGILYHEKTGNIGRLGISLYGLKPNYLNKLPKGIKPALTWKSTVTFIQEIKKGETIGYGRTYKAKKDMKIAVISVGYADGYRRALSNKGKVYIRGKEAPVVGNVCMDQIMADVSHIKGVTFEDEVCLICDKYDADTMAKDINTIGYEVVCGISKRVERIYK